MSTSQRYNLAYNYVFDKESQFHKNILINGSSDPADTPCRADRDVVRQFTKEVCRVAESDMEIPAVKCNYVVPQVSGVK